MTLDAWFGLANAVALVGWIALLLAPVQRRFAVTVARSVGAMLAIGYLVLFIASLSAAQALGQDYSLRGIAGFFADPRLALLGWVHYLAFDLWVGAWEIEAAERAAMPHWLVVPALLFTFLLGPIGLVMFLAGRLVIGRQKRRAATW